MLVKEEQPKKTVPPILVKPAGRVILLKEEQPLKASYSILVKPAGRVILVKEEQPLKAFSPIRVTFELSSTDFMDSLNEYQGYDDQSP